MKVWELMRDLSELKAGDDIYLNPGDEGEDVVDICNVEDVGDGNIYLNITESLVRPSEAPPMDDATRERWADRLTLLSHYCAYDEADELQKIAAFLRSDQCPRDGDVLLRRCTDAETGSYVEDSDDFVFSRGVYFKGNDYLRRIDIGAAP